MSKYIVSARKYRPIKFEDVLGQEHVTTTLKNAITNDKIAQAFLFCGPRGVGKTTCARLLAKTINCLQVNVDGEPCGECQPCRSFAANSSFNIYELDAASNNSVEDIRSLVDQVRYPPQDGKYKVYIIDEVHMLSNAAFNAFLKTLEEPPSYVVFILATTEKHKIIPTILSRCQIYDFKSIDQQNIAKQLIQILEKENIEYEKEAVNLIAEKSEGSLRDALSIFDRIVAFGEGKSLYYKTTTENLHILDYEYYFQIVDSILRYDFPRIYNILDKIVINGFELFHFITGLTEHVRTLWITKKLKGINIQSFSEKLKALYLSQASEIEEEHLVIILNICSKCELNYKLIQNKRAHIELALINMMYGNSDDDNLPNLKKTNSTENNSASSTATHATQTKNLEKQKIKTEKIETPVEQKKEKISKTTSLQPPATNKYEDKETKNSLDTFRILSIDDIKKQVGEKLEKKNEETKNSPEIAPTTELEEAEVIKAFEKFKLKLKEEGRHTDHGIFIKNPKYNENTLCFEFDSKIKDDIFNNIKVDILEYLKNVLLVKELKLKSVVEVDEKLYIPYTNRDKFMSMAELNSDLLILKDSLQLDIDV